MKLKNLFIFLNGRLFCILCKYFANILTKFSHFGHESFFVGELRDLKYAWTAKIVRGIKYYFKLGAFKFLNCYF